MVPLQLSYTWGFMKSNEKQDTRDTIENPVALFTLSKSGKMLDVLQEADEKDKVKKLHIYHHVLFSHLFVDGHGDCFHFLTGGDSAARSMEM